ncbi:MAG: hypothetical protein H6742_08730 [Alphaproteobacteria bacterium]|nr:hypothetical protein [Alphaproteobacteria bacterium]
MGGIPVTAERRLEVQARPLQVVGQGVEEAHLDFVAAEGVDPRRGAAVLCSGHSSWGVGAAVAEQSAPRLAQALAWLPGAGDARDAAIEATVREVSVWGETVALPDDERWGPGRSRGYSACGVRWGPRRTTLFWAGGCSLTLLRDGAVVAAFGPDLLRDRMIREGHADAAARLSPSMDNILGSAMAMDRLEVLRARLPALRAGDRLVLHCDRVGSALRARPGVALDGVASVSASELGLEPRHVGPGHRLMVVQADRT